MAALTLKTGRVVKTGLIPATRAQLNRMRCVRFRDVLPAPPAACFNASLVDFFTMGGNGPALPDDESYQGNPLGDCVPCFLANGKRVLSTVTGGAEVKINAEEITNWYLAATGGEDNGMNIGDAMTLFASTGMKDTAGAMHVAGPSAAIDWTNQIEVMQAISLFKTLGVGVAADQLQNAVGDTNGWLLQGARRDTNYDHCPWLCGYGAIEQLAALGKVPVPPGANANGFYVALVTWGTWGFVDWQSFLNITGEAHCFVTDPDRFDSETWNPVANADYAEITGATPTPIPPAPRPPCPRRATELLDAHPEWEQPLFQLLLDRALSGGAP